MNSPKISVLVPVYNVSAFLRECMDSIVSQTLSDLEIICIDDGSTDDSPAILKEYADRDPRIRIITKKNTGYGNSMNIGLDAATGEYIGIVEPDDFIPPDMFESLYQCAKDKDLDLVKADYYKFWKNEDNEWEYQLCRVRKTIAQVHYQKVFCPRETPSSLIALVAIWAGIYRRDFVVRNQIRFHETPGASYQDNGFFFMTFALADRAFYMNRPLYRYRRDNPNSSMNNKAKVYCMDDEYKYIRAFLSEHPDLEKTLLCPWRALLFRQQLFTYQRIANEFKHEYILHMSKDLKQAQANQELDMSLFTDVQKRDMESIINDPIGFDRRSRRAVKMGKSWLGKQTLLFKAEREKNGLKAAVRKTGKSVLNQIKPAHWTFWDAPVSHMAIKYRKCLKKLGLSNQKMRRIQALKGTHDGQRCFIICTGPSLRLEDLEKLKNETTIGVNSIFAVYPKTSWRPTYYTIVDPYQGKKYIDMKQINFNDLYRKAAFLNSRLHAPKKDEIYKVHVDTFNHKSENMQRGSVKIDDDLDIHVYDCFTVTVMAIELAIYLGFKEVYILGADCNYEQPQKHFVPTEADAKISEPGKYKLYVDRSIRGYQAAKELAQSCGVKVYNATRGGKLEVFDRVDFDALMSK